MSNQKKLRKDDIKCANCKHWNKGGEDIEATRFARCNGVHHREEAFGWDEGYKNYSLRQEHEKDLALAIDGSGYFAGLITKADFFCAHHKESDE